MKNNRLTIRFFCLLLALCTLCAAFCACTAEEADSTATTDSADATEGAETSEDMLTDEEGHIYMIFDSSEMSGWVKATCTYEVNDSDVEGDTRREVNDQWLCFVTSNPTPNLYDTPAGGDGHVVYTRVYGSDVHTAWLNLRDSSHQPLRDSEGRQLRVHRSESEVFEDK
jgi:hypothetical protein